MCVRVNVCVRVCGISGAVHGVSGGVTVLMVKSSSFCVTQSYLCLLVPILRYLVTRSCLVVFTPYSLCASFWGDELFLDNVNLRGNLKISHKSGK